MRRCDLVVLRAWRRQTCCGRTWTPLLTCRERFTWGGSDAGRKWRGEVVRHHSPPAGKDVRDQRFLHVKQINKNLIQANMVALMLLYSLIPWQVSENVLSRFFFVGTLPSYNFYFPWNSPFTRRWEHSLLLRFLTDCKHVSRIKQRLYHENSCKI